jgi:hypothetical protein
VPCAWSFKERLLLHWVALSAIFKTNCCGFHEVAGHCNDLVPLPIIAVWLVLSSYCFQCLPNNVTYLLLSTKLSSGNFKSVTCCRFLNVLHAVNILYILQQPIYIMYIHYFSPSFSVLALDCRMRHWPDFTSQTSKSHAAIWSNQVFSPCLKDNFTKTAATTRY